MELFSHPERLDLLDGGFDFELVARLATLDRGARGIAADAASLETAARRELVPANQLTFLECGRFHGHEGRCVTNAGVRSDRVLGLAAGDEPTIERGLDNGGGRRTGVVIRSHEVRARAAASPFLI